MRNVSKVKFEKISDYCIKAGTYTIAKVKVHGKWIFECWNVNEYLRKYEDPDDAKKYIERLIGEKHG